jgi:hypothetical protein
MAILIFRGQRFHATRGPVELEAWQDERQVVCIARLGSKRFELATNEYLWGVTVQQVAQQALDNPLIEASPPRKLEKRIAPPVTPPRRRAIRSIVSNPPPTD